MAGLKLDKLDVATAALDQPAKIAAQASLNGAPVVLTGTVGAPAILLPGSKPGAPVPLDVSLQALGSSLSVKGSVGTGADGRPSVQAELVADKIEADAVRSALAKPQSEQGTPPPATGAPPSSTRASGTMIPDTPIPFGPLRLADADVKLNIAQLKTGGALYRAIAGHIVLRNGKLQVDPLSADLPEGHVNASLSADAAQQNPPVAIRAQIPALALPPLLAAMGKPEMINGSLNVQADLHGAGTTPHAIASTLDGSFSVTMGKGTIDNRLLGRYACVGAARDQHARPGRSRRHQPGRVLCGQCLGKSRGRHVPCAGLCLVSVDHGWRWQREPGERNARSASASAGKGGGHPDRRADADQRAVAVASDSA